MHFALFFVCVAVAWCAWISFYSFAIATRNREYSGKSKKAEAVKKPKKSHLYTGHSVQHTIQKWSDTEQIKIVQQKFMLFCIARVPNKRIQYRKIALHAVDRAEVKKNVLNLNGCCRLSHTNGIQLDGDVKNCFIRHLSVWIIRNKYAFPIQPTNHIAAYCVWFEICLGVFSFFPSILSDEMFIFSMEFFSN